MEPFTEIESLAVPLIRDNVDTDAIIPSREMRTVSKKGLADGLFAGWRYVAIGSREPDPRFVLNDPLYRGASILLGGANFGCGSSREHAVWALAEYGFRVVIAPSFNPIFRANCVANGVVPIEMDPWQFAKPIPLRVDLTEQIVETAAARRHFDIGGQDKLMLLNGFDVIDLTLRMTSQIEQFRACDRHVRPWAYLDKRP